MLNYPSAAAFPIAYNVPPGGMLEDVEWVPDSPTHVTTVAAPPALTYDEADEVHDYAAEAIPRHLRQTGLPRLTELCDSVWSLANLGDVCWDRTLALICNYLPMLNEAFIGFLQSDLLRHFPLWRTLHCEDSEKPELNFAVYPQAVSVGHEVFTGDYSGAISKWRRAVFTHREPQAGPQRRQLNWIQQRLLAKPRGYWKKAVPVVLGAFDNFEGDQSGQSVWLLVRDTGLCRARILGPPEMAHGKEYPIRNNGHIGELMHSPGPAGLRLVQVVLPKQHSQRLTVRPSRRGPVVDIAIDEFLCDADLPDRDGGLTQRP